TTTTTTTNRFVWCATESDDDLFLFANLWQAYEACRRRKAHTSAAQRYELNLLDELDQMLLALRQGRFHPSPSICFIAAAPKAREIHAAAFADRVVHHLLVPKLEALFEPLFIHDLYSNRKDKGTHRAVSRLQQFMRRYADMGGGWFLKLDIANFFNSINRRILYQLLDKRLVKLPDGNPKKQLRWLTRLFLTGNPALSAHHQEPVANFQRLPAHKRLINAAPECGLPIGNLTSQFFANVYLNQLDQHVKYDLKCRHYLRYVDDLILLADNPQQLLVWREQIVDFLQRQLHLTLKMIAEPRPIQDGADFLGYIVRPHYRLVRRRVVASLSQSLRRRWLQHLAGDGVLRFNETSLNQLRAVLASYLGHFSHAQSHRVLAKIWQKFPFLAQLFDLQDRGLQPRWRPKCVTSLVSQWRYFQCRWPEALVMLQVGKRWLITEPHLQLARSLAGPCLTYRVRLGLGECLELTATQRQRLQSRLIQYRKLWIEVCEAGYLRTGFKRRTLTAIYNPNISMTHSSGS
ncbi:MAG: hypothetical protein II007_00755, partial [Gammaproteobacteria bacterium]|nr:hypothetical protein [Gammaproteobacteria bacterium]